MVISYPIPPYSNVPIETAFYQPSRFLISDIDLGATTTVTTSVDMNFVVGQLVRLIIPPPFKSRQLNDVQGYVISIPSDNQVELDIDSSQGVNAFCPNPYDAAITNATQASMCVLTADNCFKAGQLLTISDVEGMTELNGSNRLIYSATSTTITLEIDSTTFTAYSSDGTVVLQGPKVGYAQIVAVGDINTGYQSSSGRSIATVNGDTQIEIPGSFINISPQ